jgi:hypothetical protein
MRLTGSLLTDYSFTYSFCRSLFYLSILRVTELTFFINSLDLDGTVEVGVSASGYIQSAYYAQK